MGAVAFDDGREAERGCGWIPLLAVAEPWRRRGYGVQLIGQAVMHYRPMGRDRLRLPHAGDGGRGGLLPGVRLFSGGGRAGVGKVHRI